MVRVEPVRTPRRDTNDSGRPEWEVTTVEVPAGDVSLIDDGWEPVGVAHYTGATVRVLLRRKRWQ